MKPIIGLLLIVAIVIGGVFWLKDTPADQIDLVPHRAVYAMSLASVRPGSGVVGASGTMTYVFGDTCDGWVVDHKSEMDFSYSEGQNLRSVWTFSTWEAKDGLRYRFKVRSLHDGQVAEEIDGSAVLDGIGKAGAASFVLPEERKLDLPKGTLFPAAHTSALLIAAKEGQTLLSKLVFDGSDTSGLMSVTAAIGRLRQPETVPEGISPLLQTPFWHINLAFFVPDAQEAEPDYEIGIDYHANGVAHSMSQDFGDFSLKGELQSLEALPRPDC